MDNRDGTTSLQNRTDVTRTQKRGYQRSVSREEVDVRIWEADFLFEMKSEGWGWDG
jgi:hypothetical protein